MSVFEREVVVRFEHCDAAGLMFYPRLFALVNEMVEDWFAAMEHSFACLHVDQRKGVPTVEFEAEFLRPIRMGERLVQSLRVLHIGHASCRLLHEAQIGGDLAARFEQTLVYVDLNTIKSEEWPLDLRATMTRYEEQL
ncbi:MAG: acyl-CoA thioesterase [Proteobacteria bacterium]|nr:acyl-CoA thioesterase [Pseudomonadota bacterium]